MPMKSMSAHLVHTVHICNEYTSQMSWSSILLRMFALPRSMLPEVRDTSGDFGHTDPDIFGASIPISAVVGDQSASMFGHGCFEAGDIKCTLGESSFSIREGR